MSKLLHATCPKVKWCLILLRTHYPCLFPLWKMSINLWNEYILQTEEVQITFANLHGTWRGHKALKGAPPFLKSPFLGHPTAYRRLSHSVKWSFLRDFQIFQALTPVYMRIRKTPLSVGWSWWSLFLWDFPLQLPICLGSSDKGRNLLHLRQSLPRFNWMRKVGTVNETWLQQLISSVSNYLM